jgi:hypothetical protein
MKAVKAVKVVRPLYADFYEELYDNEVAKKKQNDHFFTNFQIPEDTKSRHLDFVESLLKGLNDSMRDYAAIFGINYSSNKSMFDKDFQPTKVVIEGISDFDEETGGTFCKDDVFAKDGINVDYLTDNAAIYSTLYLTSENISNSKKTTRDKTKAMLVFYYNQTGHCLEIKALCANQIKRFPLAGSKIISFFLNSVIHLLSNHPENHIELCVNSVHSAINFYKNNDFEKEDTSSLLTQTIGKKTGERFSSLEPIDEYISDDSSSKEEDSQLNSEEGTQSSLEEEGTQSSLEEEDTQSSLKGNTQSSLEGLENRFYQASQESQAYQESQASQKSSLDLDLFDFNSNSDPGEVQERLSENESQRSSFASDLDLFNSLNSEDSYDSEDSDSKEKERNMKRKGGRRKTKKSCKKPHKKSRKKIRRKSRRKPHKKARRKTKKRNN